MTHGVLAATPYPHIAKVTSHHEQVSSLAEFHSRLVAHAQQGHCLFGGQLTRPLKNESRAGAIAHEPKPWVVFDFDKVEGKDHADVVERYLPNPRALTDCLKDGTTLAATAPAGAFFMNLAVASAPRSERAAAAGAARACPAPMSGAVAISTSRSGSRATSLAYPATSLGVALMPRYMSANVAPVRAPMVWGPAAGCEGSEAPMGRYELSGASGMPPNVELERRG